MRNLILAGTLTFILILQPLALAQEKPSSRLVTNPEQVANPEQKGATDVNPIAPGFGFEFSGFAFRLSGFHFYSVCFRCCGFG